MLKEKEIPSYTLRSLAVGRGFSGWVPARFGIRRSFCLAYIQTSEDQECNWGNLLSSSTV